MSIIRGSRYPVGTWRVCQQCREFYTVSKPCSCRRSGHEEDVGRLPHRPWYLRVLTGLETALKRLRGVR